MRPAQTELGLSRVGLPAWLDPVAAVADGVRGDQLSRFLPPPEGGRDSAVLILLGGDAAPGHTQPGQRPGEVLLIQRAHTLNSHPGQPAFPGGATDPEDGGPVGTALREAVEETGVDPAGVQPFATLPALFLPPSGFVVTPVLGWWREPSPVRAVDAAEVRSVHRVTLDDLVAPANRVLARHPSGFVGPAFRVQGLFVWGFTAGLLARLVSLSGWEQPWDRTVPVDLPELDLPELDVPAPDRS
jgi:8-oxo-dGTP pyrophosphatase MutT (NUDIX family)